MRLCLVLLCICVCQLEYIEQLGCSVGPDGVILDADGNEFVVDFAPVLETEPKPQPFVRHDCLKSSSAMLQFGLRDLVLRGDFTACSSELEFSYGIGLTPGSQEAKTFLAGAELFSADLVEIWAVGTFEEGAQANLTGGNVGPGYIRRSARDVMDGEHGSPVPPPPR